MPNWKKLITSGSDAALNSLNVSTSLTASGLIYPTADSGEKSFIQSDGNGNLSLQYVNTTNDTVYNGETFTLIKGTPVYVSGSVGANPKVFAADAANPAKMPVTYIIGDNIPTAETGRGIILGQIDAIDTTGFPEGVTIYAKAGGSWTDIRPTGSAIIQILGIVTKEGSGGKGLVLNPGPANLPNIPSGHTWIGNSNSYPIATATSSIQNVVSSSYAQTSSYALNADLLDGRDSTTFASTGSNQFNGSQTITGSFTVVTGSAVELQVTNTGVNIGSIITDTHTVTGSFNISGSSNIRGALTVGNITPSIIIGRIDASNDVVAFSTSDKCLKENIQPIENALDKLDKIGGYTFNWNNQVEIHGYEGHDIGVIAQEIESILPEIVTTRDNGYKAVKYEKIVPFLIQCIKELKDEIHDLKSQK